MLLFLRDFKCYVNPEYVTDVFIRETTVGEFMCIVEVAHSDNVMGCLRKTEQEATELMLATAEMINFYAAVRNNAGAPAQASEPSTPQEQAEVGTNKVEFIKYMSSHGFQFSQLLRDEVTGEIGMAVSHVNPINEFGDTNTMTFTGGNPVETIDAMLTFFAEVDELKNTKTGEDYTLLPTFRKILNAARKPPVSE